MKNWLKAVGVILLFTFIAVVWTYFTLGEKIDTGILGFTMASIIGIEFYKDRFNSGKHFYDD